MERTWLPVITLHFAIIRWHRRDRIISCAIRAGAREIPYAIYFMLHAYHSPNPIWNNQKPPNRRLQRSHRKWACSPVKANFLQHCKSLPNRSHYFHTRPHRVTAFVAPFSSTGIRRAIRLPLPLGLHDGQRYLIDESSR